jgi:hypothetical protein
VLQYEQKYLLVLPLSLALDKSMIIESSFIDYSLLLKANLKASPLPDRYSTIEYNAFLNDVNTIFHSS